jgi:hypothetical protein
MEIGSGGAGKSKISLTFKAKPGMTDSPLSSSPSINCYNSIFVATIIARLKGGRRNKIFKKKKYKTV